MSEEVTEDKTSQEALIERELEENDSILDSAIDDLGGLAADARNALVIVVHQADPPTLDELQEAYGYVSSLAGELEDAASALRSIIDGAKALEPAHPVCVGIPRVEACGAPAEYLAPDANAEVGEIVWAPVCKRHAAKWWDTQPVRGIMMPLGDAVKTPEA